MIADPFPTDSLGQKLCQIFAYLWMSLEGETEDTTAPNWRTIRNYPLRPRSLWAKWQDPAVLVGVRFGSETEYALIDIDKGSKFLSLTGINAIRDALATIGIVRTIVIRSSWSGGIHLYCPLPAKVATFDLACAIKYALAAQEIHLEAGQVESFPNVKAFAKGWLGQFSEYNGHRLPLQPGGGGVILNSDLQPAGAELRTFFAQWDFCAAAQDLDLLTEAMSQGRDSHRKKPKQRNHPLDEWRRDWELDINEGWTAHGQTNSLLKTMAGYGRVFLRLEGEDLHDFVVTTATQSPGFEDFCGHHYDIGRKAISWCRAAERYYWPLGSEAKRDKAAFDFNSERSLDAQSRIKAAFEHLVQQAEWPELITQQLKKLAELARASFATLYKYAHLWRPAERCVIDQPASITADSPPLPNDPDDPPKTAPSKGITHLDQNTKGVSLENLPSNQFTQEEGGVQGGKKGFPQAEGA